MNFRLVPKLLTLNDLERRNGHFQVIRTKDETGRATCHQLVGNVL